MLRRPSGAHGRQVDQQELPALLTQLRRVEVEEVTEPSLPFVLPSGTVTFLLAEVVGVEGSSPQAGPASTAQVVGRIYELVDAAIRSPRRSGATFTASR